MGYGLSGLGAFVKGAAAGYSFTTDELRKAQEAEARQNELDVQKGVQEAMKAMPNMEEYRRPVYKEGQAPAADFVGPPTNEQVEGWVHDSYGYMQSLNKASDLIKDPTKREVFKTAGMQPLHDEARRYGVQAMMYMNNNQPEAAYKALQKGYSYMPDGQSVELIRGDDGQIGAMRIKDHQGNIVQDYAPLLTKEQFTLAAAAMVDPKAYFTIATGMDRNAIAREQLAQDARQHSERLKWDEEKFEKLDKREREQFEATKQLQWANYGISLAQLNMTAEDRAAAQKAAAGAMNLWTDGSLHAQQGVGNGVIDTWLKNNPQAAKMGTTEGANSQLEAKAIMEGFLLLNGPPRFDSATGKPIGMSGNMAAALSLIPYDKSGELLKTYGLDVRRMKPDPNNPNDKGKVFLSVNGRPVIMPPEFAKFMSLGESAEKAKAEAAAGGAPGAPAAPAAAPRGLGAVLDQQRPKPPVELTPRVPIAPEPWKNWGAQNPPEAGMGELVTGSSGTYAPPSAPQRAGLMPPAPQAPQVQAPQPPAPQSQAPQITNMNPQQPPAPGQVMRDTAPTIEEAKKKLQNYTDQGIPAVVTVSPKGLR